AALEADYCEPMKPFICDTGSYLMQAQKEGKSILFEAQLGALRDLDRGIWPFTTSSNTTTSYIAIGSGMPGVVIDDVTGVVKAYSTCVGEGPFVSEMSGPEADRLREEGAEYGAKTGRARRVGAYDCVATRHGVIRQAATEIALTKLDVLSYMDRIPVCTAYRVDGELTQEFPFPSALDSAEPVIEYLDGWKSDISGARKWEDLPEAARKYVSFIEKSAGCPVVYISVGPERDSIIVRENRKEEWLGDHRN
ncbi:MAG: adenylosuccinate synthetase, partial [Oscillospiraceae bacterium]|nr:adenylosuccinate synthetase [Oscillospiraceae bacterium]